MIAPEVWNFPPPNHHIEIITDELGDDIPNWIKKRIHSHYFNKMVSIVLPNSTKTPSEIVNVLNKSDTYLVKSLSLKDIIKRSFINGFVQQGDFYGLSNNTKIVTDDCAAITPCGKIILSLNKDTYQSLGLEGHVSYFSKIYRNRYIVQIDLKSSLLVPGKSLYDRLNLIFSGDLLPKWDFCITWTPHAADICPSSVAKYFSDLNYTIQHYDTKFLTKCEDELNIPKIQKFNKSFNGKSNKTTDGWVSNMSLVKDLVEFIGMVTLSCNFVDDENYLNSYEMLNDVDLIGSVQVALWKGMFGRKEISDLVTQLRKYLVDNTEIPWIGIYVHGFPDSPISFGLKEHNCLTNGDNSYVLILTKGGQLIYYQIVSSNKLLK